MDKNQDAVFRIERIATIQMIAVGVPLANRIHTIIRPFGLISYVG